MSIFARKITYKKKSKSILAAMRTKHLILILIGVIIATVIFIVFGPAGEPNDSFKHIVVQTHQQLKELQENLRVGSERKKLQLDSKYLILLGYTSSLGPKGDPSHQSDQQLAPTPQIPTPAVGAVDTTEFQGDNQSLGSDQLQKKDQRKRITTPYSKNRANFTIVTYVQEGQAASVILLAQNIASKLPAEYLLIYDLGVSEEQLRSLSSYCNNSRCAVITFDLSVFPSVVNDQRTHAYRPVVIRDALRRAKSVLFTENYMRIRGNSRDLLVLYNRSMASGILGWNTPTAVSSRTHPKMFDFFQSDAEDFIFLRMVNLDAIFFVDSTFVADKILQPWLMCSLTFECIDPIGAQSIGCKFNKKPLYRYSGCHGYDASAFNIVLGINLQMDDSKYSLPINSTENMFYKETLEQATKILENRRRNTSDTSDHPFTED